MVQNSSCKRTQDPSSSQCRLKQQKIWEVKKNLANDRIKSLEKTIGEFSKTNTPMIPPLTLKPTSDLPSFNYAESSMKRAEEVQGKILLPKVKPTTYLCCHGVQTSAMEHAKAVQAKLSPNFPTFLKLMLKSHISGGFWLGLPKKFCVEYLPNVDVTMALVDENGKESYAKFLAEKNGLSGGWRGFSIAHELLDGDVLVFQLIEKCKFKVCIVRARRSTEMDAATGLQNLASQPVFINKVKIEEETEDRSSETFNASKEMASGFGDFTIHVDGLILNSEIPVRLRKKYHELCLSQRRILHDNLIKGLNTKLAAGMISETISIAFAVRAIKSVSAVDRLESWDRTLKAFEDVGMGVGFIRTRIHILQSLYSESQAIIGSKKTERAAAEAKMRDLRIELSQADVAIKCLEAEIKALEGKNETLEYVFKEVARTPW